MAGSCGGRDARTYRPHPLPCRSPAFGVWFSLLVAVGCTTAAVTGAALGSSLRSGPASIGVAGIPSAGGPVRVAPVAVRSASVERAATVAADGGGVGVGGSDYGGVACRLPVALGLADRHQHPTRAEARRDDGPLTAWTLTAVSSVPNPHVIRWGIACNTVTLTPPAPARGGACGRGASRTVRQPGTRSCRRRG